jgi:HlyD family secretion protein
VNQGAAVPESLFNILKQGGISKMSIERPTPSTRFHFPFLTKKSKKPSNNAPKKKRYWIYGIIITLILLGSIIPSLLPLEAKILTVGRGEFTKGFTEEAQVLASKEWALYNAVDGKVSLISTKNGDHVSKGQVLLEMDTSDLSFQLNTLRAQLKSLEGQRLQTYREPYTALVKQQSLMVEQAEKDTQTMNQALNRTKVLYEVGAISLTDFEEAQRQAEKAKNFLEQQKSSLQLLYEQQMPAKGTDLIFEGQKESLTAQIKQLEERIKNSKITSPQDGLVKDLTAKVGSLIPQGQLLLYVFKDLEYKLESYVLASDALELARGNLVAVLQDTGSSKKALSGQIEFIEPSAVERISPLGLKEKRVRVIIELKDATSVILGSSMDVTFTTQKELNQLMVPKTALFPYQDGHAVWIVRDGKAKIQPIIKGLENDRQVVIKEGLLDGDQILLDTNLKGLKEGKGLKAQS